MSCLSDDRVTDLSSAVVVITSGSYNAVRHSDVPGEGEHATWETQSFNNMTTFDFDDAKPAIIVVITVLNLALNSLVIAVIVKHPQLREDRTTLFMLSLALSDLAIGCTTMPISALVCSDMFPTVRKEVRHLPRIQAFISAWFLTVSTNSLCWMTLCKMLAITNPLRIETILNRQRCYYIITGIWLSGFVVACTFCIRESSWKLETCVYDIHVTPTLPSDTVAVLILGVTIGLLIPQIVIAYSTVKIWNAILQTHRQIAALSSSIGGRIGVYRNTPTMTLKSIHSGRNVLIICLMYFILTIPAGVYAIAVMLRTEDSLPTFFHFLSIWLLFSNTFINSLFYVVLFKCIRRKTIEILKDCGNLFTLW